MKHPHIRTLHAADRGYTLTEVMVAITLAVFLLMGLFSILQQTRNASNETTGLSQLQDDERVAMTILTDTIQQAGYTPTPSGTDQGLFAPDSPVFDQQGQLFIAGPGAVAGERLTLRYVLDLNDTALTCLGTLNTGPKKVFKEIFEINTFNGSPQALACSSDDGVAEQPLVYNVVNLTFQFAVNTTSAVAATLPNAVGPNTETTNNTGVDTDFGCPADTYIPTAHMSPNDWTNVCAVKVSIVFINPLYQPAGQPSPTPGQPQYVTFERVIGVLSKTGVNVTTVTTT
jgi:type IV pilus assembly protein PilW